MSNDTATDPALAYATAMRFSVFTSRETINEAYAAHLRILAKIAARKAAAKVSA